MKWWEVGNELYGNGYYYGGCGWEADMHYAYPPNMAATCTGRNNNVALSPATYGMAVKESPNAMKAVDPTIEVARDRRRIEQRVHHLERRGPAEARCPAMRLPSPCTGTAGKTLGRPLPTVPENGDPRAVHGACAAALADRRLRLRRRRADRGDQVGGRTTSRA